MIDERGFRLNIGIIITNDHGQLLWAHRSGSEDAWQFPQGGIHEGETPLLAMYRELTEEEKQLREQQKQQRRAAKQLRQTARETAKKEKEERKRKEQAEEEDDQAPDSKQRKEKKTSARCK